jgi:Lon protease-like protein
MSSADDELLGLFPLGIVLLPGEVVPLHIFEERYKLLVQERLDGGEFGIILADDEGARECGCTARVAELLEELDDGRMNILVEGGRRFRVADLHQPDDPATEYLSGLVEYFDDEDVEAPEQLRAAVLQAFRKMLLLMDVEAPREPVGGQLLSFRVAAAVDFGTPLKQELLESVSETARLETLTAVMANLLPRLELRRQREEAIRGNGKGY